MNPPPEQLTALAKQHALSLFATGISAADPYQAVQQCLTVENQQLKLRLSLDNSLQYRTQHWSKVHLIAFGKAACAMIKAARDIIPPQLLSDNAIAVTNYENVCVIEDINVFGAAHPLPDLAGLNAAQQCATIAQQAQTTELVLVLISGGGSALIPYPVDGISLADKIATTDLLLASGAPIQAINCVRKHLSRLKGGGLAKMASPADLHALILSDVLDDDLSAIASGPTVPDATTFNDALAILTQYGLSDCIPNSVMDYLTQGQHGHVAETPKADDPIFNTTSYTLVGSNSHSLNAVFTATQNLGYHPQIYQHPLCGEAKEVAEHWVLDAKQWIDQGITAPMAFLAGGETTVTLKGQGVGGRNQEMALAFALAAQKHGLKAPWLFLSGGTDGRDGPTDAAGGIVDPNTLHNIITAGLKPSDLLDNNDSYTALKSAQCLLMTGATGTNVADLQILLIYP